MKRIVFITNLNVLGGTENNLISMVSHPLFNNTFQSYLFSGTLPHDAIISRVENSNAMIMQYKNVYGFRIPRIMRGVYFKRQLKKISPDVVVFWNHVSRFRQLEICRELQISNHKLQINKEKSTHN